MNVPQPTFTFRHRTPVQLRFLDIDPMGHVNNSIYFQLMDLAKVQYFTALGGVFDGKAESLVIVNINCNFYSPAYLKEPIEVLTGIESIGDKSLRLEQRVVNATTGDVKCVCHTIMAGFDPVNVRSVPISDEWHAKISAFEGRDL
ncbi:MAG: acyl-CoA thioesterase [Muribaculaceae bacterium]|nr:acyl-CoA thioesterase [Muribaculaceae bacterium]MDE6286762.1 acyl-CoA thioesterase [Muribaculaceae bacterium]